MLLGVPYAIFKKNDSISLNLAVKIMLFENIKIFSTENIKITVELSEGIEDVSSLNKIKCSKKAFMPINKWRQPTKTDLEKIITSNLNLSNDSSVGIGKVSQTLLAELQDIIKQIISNANNESELLTDINKKLTDFISPYSVSNKDLVFAYPAIRNGGLYGSSYNNKTQSYVGLHIDSWDNAIISERENSRNRICINIGQSHRYFLFINLSIKKIVELVDKLDENALSSKNLYYYINKFYLLYPNYPVIRVKLMPGEFYIAPTENIIHDGSTIDNPHTDISLTIRGHFRISPL